ncbi:MAG: hypothetical protein M1275_03210 [Patescibacteria group bacterium]|nr:hypothetical protein [Patescibacteria group bacterium]
MRKFAEIFSLAFVLLFANFSNTAFAYNIPQAPQISPVQDNVQVISIPQKTLSKEKLKEILDKRPWGTSEQEIINGLIERGYDVNQLYQEIKSDEAKKLKAEEDWQQTKLHLIQGIAIIFLLIILYAVYRIGRMLIRIFLIADKKIEKKIKSNN